MPLAQSLLHYTLISGQKKKDNTENQYRPYAAGDRDRTGTGITTHGILSPGRLPVPPRRHLPYNILVKKRDMHELHIALVGPIGLEPMTLCL